MIINPITNGIVLDHIKPGGAMQIYNVLKLGNLGCTVAMIMNADSVKMGKKDIVKIFDLIDINLDIIGYLDPGITVSIIRDGVLAKRIHLELPEEVHDVITCRNPRCITSIEQELPQIFKLTNKEQRTYRCIYCESKAKEN